MGQNILLCTRWPIPRIVFGTSLLTMRLAQVIEEKKQHTPSPFACAFHTIQIYQPDSTCAHLYHHTSIEARKKYAGRAGCSVNIDVSM
jgi:hypothetical protein